MPGIFDSHAHYDDGQFDRDRETLLAALHAGGVEHILTVGADLPSSGRAADLAAAHSFLHAAVGIHPEACGEDPGRDLEALRALARRPKVVAVGEIGLDYYRKDNPPRALQRRYFEAQLLLAAELSLPVIVHDRDAHQEIFDLLRKHRPRGVVHCYSGSAELAKELCGMGLYLGFTGVVTYPGARRAREAAAVVPEDRLLIETDCPYMAPVPYRGRRSDSSMLTATADALAAVRGISRNEVIRTTCENARRLFGIPG